LTRRSPPGSAITSETGPYSHHSESPLLQVNAANVSTRKTPASAHAKNRITRSDTNACRHRPTRARTTSTAATSNKITTTATTRMPVDVD
jgi:hypothetical protein